MSVRSGPGLWLPTTADEIRGRGWDAPDVVFVTGDAYVDHPSFAMAVLSRVLDSRGFRVAILPQPNWRSATAWRALGRPRLFYAVSAGNSRFSCSSLRNFISPPRGPVPHQPHALLRVRAGS